MVNKKKTLAENNKLKDGQSSSGTKNSLTGAKNDDSSTSMANSMSPRCISETKGKSAIRSPDVRDKQPQMAVRSSGRIIKRPRKDLTPPPPSSPPPSPPKKIVKEVTPIKIPKARQTWSAQDVNVFFDALGEHGRNFDAIQNYICHKYKKMPEKHKSKEQIRFFYYRSAKKLAKVVHLEEEVNKKVVELYSLINFGEFRKKGIYRLDEKTVPKLIEMILTGATVFKVKGKNVRFRTPACKALQKLNQSNEVKEDPKTTEVKLPHQVVLELYPKNAHAWTEVQQLSQNPRLRLKLKPGKRLTSIYEFLASKWKSERAKLREQEDKTPEISSKEMTFYAPEECNFCYYEIKPPPAPMKKDVSMSHYLEQLKNKKEQTTPKKRKKKERNRSISLPVDPNSNITFKSCSEDAVDGSLMAAEYSRSGDHTESLDTTVDGSSKTPCESDASTSSKVLNFNLINRPTEDCDNQTLSSPPSVSTHLKDLSSPECTTSHEESKKGNAVPFKEEQKDNVVKDTFSENDPVQIASASSLTRPIHGKAHMQGTYLVHGMKKSRSKHKAPPPEIPLEDKDKSPWRLKVEKKMKLLREGMTKIDAEQFLVGDLCLMMGSPEKVVLLYDWVEESSQTVPDVLQMGSMTNVLRRLLHVASAEFSELRQPQPGMQAILDEANAASLPKTVSIGVQVNCPIPVLTRSPKGSSPSVNGNSSRRLHFVHPSTPKSAKESKEPTTPTTPTTPKSQVSLPFRQPEIVTQVTTAQSTVSNIINQVTRAQTTSHINIAPNPHQSTETPVFKIPTTVPLRPQIKNIAPNPYQDMNPQKFNIPRMRRRNVRQQRRPLAIQRRIIPKAENSNPGGIMQLTLMPGSEIPQMGNDTQLLNFQENSVIPTSSSQTGPRPKTIIMHPKGIVTGSVPQPAVTKYTIPASGDGKAKITVIDPMHFAKNASCRRIIPTPAGAVTGDKEQSDQVIDNPAQSMSSLENVNVSSAVGLLKTAIADQSTITTDISSGTATTHTTVLSSGTCTEGDSMSGFASILQDLEAETSTPKKSTVSSQNEQDAQLSGTRSSPTNIGNISSILDISLTVAPGVDQQTDNLIDLALENSTQSFSALLDTTSADLKSHEKDLGIGCGILSESGSANKLSLTSNVSQLEPEYQWLGGDDFNLSSFLDTSSSSTTKPSVTMHEPSTSILSLSMMTDNSRDSMGLGSLNFLDTPKKSSNADNSRDSIGLGSLDFLDTPKKSSSTALTSCVSSVTNPHPLNILGENSRDSLLSKFDVDSTLQTAMNESSIDYMSKFADLVQEVTENANDEKEESLF